MISSHSFSEKTTLTNHESGFGVFEKKPPASRATLLFRMGNRTELKNRKKGEEEGRLILPYIPKGSLMNT